MRANLPGVGDGPASPMPGLPGVDCLALLDPIHVTALLQITTSPKMYKV